MCRSVLTEVLASVVCVCQLDWFSKLCVGLCQLEEISQLCMCVNLTYSLNCVCE